MIELIFTIDYEIYGNGGGSLRELVFEPAARLQEVFRKRKIRFVPFVEVAELETIEAHGTDPAIDLVKQQIRDFYDDLVGWPGRGEEWSAGPLRVSDALDRAPGWDHFLHCLSEQLIADRQATSGAPANVARKQ